jgi:hypothetical protein
MDIVLDAIQNMSIVGRICILGSVLFGIIFVVAIVVGAFESSNHVSPKGAGYSSSGGGSYSSSGSSERTGEHHFFPHNGVGFMCLYCGQQEGSAEAY